MLTMKCDKCGGNVMINNNSHFGICDTCNNKTIVDEKEFEKYSIAYSNALKNMEFGTMEGLKEAIEIFEEIPFMNDSRILCAECKKQITQLESAELAEKEKIQIKEKAEAKKRIKVRVLTYLISIASLTLIISIIFIFKVRIPNKYYEKAYLAVDSVNIDQISYNWEKAKKFSKSKRKEENLIDSVLEKANELGNEKEYKDAISLLYLISEYRDVDELITEYDTSDKELQYNLASLYYQEEKYSEASEIFKNLGNYKDSEEISNNLNVILEKKRLAAVKIGEVVEFGEYYSSKGQKSAIEWIVIYSGKRYMLLVSKNGLDCISYNSTLQKISWDNTSLFKWLNNSFKKDFFSDVEKEIIAEGSNVTIPSINDYNTYFIQDSIRKCQCSEYAEYNGAKVSNSKKTRGNCMYWLKSSSDSRNIPYVDYDGTIGGKKKRPDSDGICVRPIIKVDLKINKVN